MKRSPLVRVATLLFAASALVVLVFRASSGCSSARTIAPADDPKVPQASSPAASASATTSSAPAAGGPASVAPGAPSDEAFFPATKSGAVVPLPKQPPAQKAAPHAPNAQ